MFFFKKKPGTNLYLILLEPPVESWLLRCGEGIGIVPEGFPITPAALKKYTGTPDIQKNEKFKSFLRELRDKEAPGIKFIKDIIMQFYSNDSKY